MTILIVLTSLVILLAGLAGISMLLTRRRYRRRLFDRQAAIRHEARLAEARIDQLTRLTLQRMQEAVRADLRAQSPWNRP